MKQILNNRYIKSISFQNKNGLDLFLNNNKVSKQLFIDTAYEDKYHYSLICHHSLLDEIEFILSFNSDNDSFDILFWETTSQLVLYTGTNLYLINEKLEIQTHLEYLSPLIGLYITPLNNLVIFEELSLKIMNFKGEIITNENFDLVENYEMKDDKLYIHTEEGMKIIKIF